MDEEFTSDPEIGSEATDEDIDELNRQKGISPSEIEYISEDIFKN